MRVWAKLIVAGVLYVSPCVAAAQEAPAPDCSAAPALPAELAGWASPAPLTSAASAAGLPGAALTIGQGASATLHPTGDVAYVVLPEKPGGTGASGGMFQLNIDQPGVYVVALGTGAWIDVLKGKAAVESTAHGRGPACSTIRKMVDFPLERGRYVLQVSANPSPDLAVMVARRP